MAVGGYHLDSSRFGIARIAVERRSVDTRNLTNFSESSSKQISLIVCRRSARIALISILQAGKGASISSVLSVSGCFKSVCIGELSKVTAIYRRAV